MNEAVRPLNKQDLDGNRTKENTIYSWARALNRFNAVVKEQKSGQRVRVRTPTEAEVDGHASKEAKVRGQQTFEHKNLSVKRLFPNQKWHRSSATHVHLVLISGDGANSYHKMLHCSVYSFSLWCHCQLIPINTIFFIHSVCWFPLRGSLYPKFTKRPRLKLHSCSQSWLLFPKPDRRAKLPGNLCFQYDDKRNFLSSFCLPAGLTSIKDLNQKIKMSTCWCWRWEMMISFQRHNWWWW